MRNPPRTRPRRPGRRNHRPAASKAFLKSFLAAAPATKVFTYGGDCIPVECVAGHARPARRGVARALAELVEEEWLSLDDALALVDPLLRGNARTIFKLDGGAWGQSLNSELLLPEQARGGIAGPLRIEFPCALYHVISRGNQRCPVVRDDDWAKRLNWLRGAVETYGWRVHRAASVTPCVASRRLRRDCGRLRPGCEYSLFKL